MRSGTTNDERLEKTRNLNKSVRKAVLNFKPPEQLTVSDWSDKYRRLSAENSSEAGPWRTSRTPYLKEIMDAFTDPRVHRIAVVASSQVGKTEMEMNMMAYMIDIDPGPAMFVLPTVDNAKDISKRRIAPMIRDTKPLQKKIATSKSRDSDNTLLKKAYPGGMLTITGSNSPAALASVPCRYVFGDERDRWAKDAGGEGDPWGLVEARTITFYNYKMIEVSTPTIKGHSAIEKSFGRGTQEYWSVRCPHCNEYSFVDFDHIRYEAHRIGEGKERHYIVDDVNYACPECGCSISETEVKKAPKKWIAKNPEAYANGIRSFWINAFSSPWMAWKKIILEYLEAQGDQQKMKTVYNTLFGQLWDEQTETVDEDEMLERREEYDAELPEGVLCLTCGVDTQDNRLEYEVVGYGRDRETWGIEKGFIMGKPLEDDVWERLDGIIDRTWKFKNGKGLKISVTFVDSGGHYTQEVYENCRKRLMKRVFAIKGRSAEGVPYIGVPSKAKIMRDGVVVGTTPLYIIGVDAGKERIYSDLIADKEQVHRFHFPKNEGRGYDSDFFNGLLSEKMVYKVTAKGGVWRWEKLEGHNRNEALDCRNYANAAFYALKPNLDTLYQKLNDIEPQKPVVKPRKVFRKQPGRRIERNDW